MPSFVKPFAELAPQIEEALAAFKAAVESGAFRMRTKVTKDAVH